MAVTAAASVTSVGTTSNLAARGSRSLLQRRGAAARDGHLIARTGQRDGDGAANSGTSTRDECNLGHLRTPRYAQSKTRSLAPDAATDLADVVAARERHAHLQFAADDLERELHARPAQCAETIEVGAAREVPRAPSATAFRMSCPERMPPSSSTSHRRPRHRPPRATPQSWTWCHRAGARRDSTPPARRHRAPPTWRASSGSMMPLTISLPFQRPRISSRSFQVTEASNWRGEPLRERRAARALHRRREIAEGRDCVPRSTLQRPARLGSRCRAHCGT